jgi:hypothetical protein
MTDKYYELDASTIASFDQVVASLAFFTAIKFKAIGDAKQKKLIAIKKIPDAFAYMSGYQVLVTINEPLFDKIDIDQKAVEILFVEELNKIAINTDTGAIKINKADFITSNSVLDKYTPDEVKRVKDLERLTLEQSDEQENETEQVEANATY